PPAPSGEAVAPVRHWVRFVEKLQQMPPVVLRDRTDPAATLGLERLDALQALEHELAQFPRVDFLELQQRIHRRMVRETEGTAQNGLPFFWRHALRELLRRVDKEVPEKGYRLSRLPQGGWLVTSRAGRFAIDPAGQDVERL